MTDDYTDDYTVDDNDDLAHRVERGEIEAVFHALLAVLGFDSYGDAEQLVSRALFAEAAGPRVVESDRLVVRPYYWGDDTARAALPNFVDKASGLWIKWYKYPLRGATASRPISVEEMLVVCTDIAHAYVTPEAWSAALAGAEVDPAARWRDMDVVVQADCYARLSYAAGGSVARLFKAGETVRGRALHVIDGVGGAP